MTLRIYAACSVSQTPNYTTIKKEKHQVLLLKTNNNDIGWYLHTMQGYLEKLLPPLVFAIVSSSQRDGATGI